MTRLKLALVKLFVVAASVALGWMVFKQGMTKDNFGSEIYNQGPLAQVLMSFVMAAIVVIGCASAIYYVLSETLFGPGELHAHRARQVVEEARKAAPPPAAPAPGGEHDVIN